MAHGVPLAPRQFCPCLVSHRNSSLLLLLLLLEWRCVRGICCWLFCVVCLLSALRVDEQASSRNRVRLTRCLLRWSASKTTTKTLLNHPIALRCCFRLLLIAAVTITAAAAVNERDGNRVASVNPPGVWLFWLLSSVAILLCHLLLLLTQCENLVYLTGMSLFGGEGDFSRYR